MAKIPYRILKSEQKSIKELFRENREKKEKLKNMLTQIIKTKQCKRCELPFNEILNKQSPECRYHPGGKKYFSCKDCGQDEYFTCCGKCSICEPGCSATYHV